MGQKIQTIVIDDSAVVRQVLSDILNSDPAIELFATAADPIFAMNKMKRQWPDVIILDLEMPRMDGLSFLRKIMSERPTPVIICSARAEKGAQTTMQVLAAGAVDVIAKPKVGLQGFLYEARHTITDIVKAAAKANLKKLQRNAEVSAALESRRSPTGEAAQFKFPPRFEAPKTEIPKVETPKTDSTDKKAPIKFGSAFSERLAQPKLNADAMLAPTSFRRPVGPTERIVAIGASTGGTQALELVLKSLPVSAPGIVIVQHMPAGFTAAFADRLNGICQVEVKEAEDGDRVEHGRALIAPGDKHMLLRRSGAQYFVEVKDGPVINRHRPSVDVLFRSVAQNAGQNALGIIMTGMGDDGARGMAEMHQTGAFCVAQDEETCVVYGMPKEAVKRNAVDRIMPLEEIADMIMNNKGKS
jgi:two-component system, chemotaxis family, protein-glutamate methylesterase/glutaminase